MNNVARSYNKDHKHLVLRVSILQMTELALKDIMALKKDIFCLHYEELNRTDICCDDSFLIGVLDTLYCSN